MSSLNKQSRIVEKGELTLILNAAEGRLQMVLGRVAGKGSRRDRVAPGTLAVQGAEADAELEILAAQDWLAVSQGAELLTPALQQILDNLRLKPEHIGRIAVVNGPGSFTGLRLVCVSAAALARGIAAKQASLPYLPLLAEAIRDSGLLTCLHKRHDERVIVWIMTHARRGLVYLQGFHVTVERENRTDDAGRDAKAPCPCGCTGQSDQLASQLESPLASPPDNPGADSTAQGVKPELTRPVCELQVLEIDAAAEFLREQFRANPGIQVLLGSGLSKNRESFMTMLNPNSINCYFMPSSFDLPSAALLLRQAYQLEYTHEDITPIYARASDAEENLPQIAAKLGLDPEYAVKRLEDLMKE